ncbi:MAG: hypothetical protein KBS52_03770 [Clostridiales bacterium]|nr:hypothetical protein [Candidatus Equinaster intestinalis]
MSDGIISALLALLGTMFGTFGGIITSGKLTNYRIEQLEKKVDRHNNFALRIPIIEERINAMKQKIDETQERKECYEDFKGNPYSDDYDGFGRA